MTDEKFVIQRRDPAETISLLTMEILELRGKLSEAERLRDLWKFEHNKTVDALGDEAMQHGETLRALAARKDVVKAARAWRAMLRELGNTEAYNRPPEVALIAAIDTFEGESS